jgi:hypothetical protein
VVGPDALDPDAAVDADAAIDPEATADPDPAVDSGAAVDPIGAAALAAGAAPPVGAKPAARAAPTAGAGPAAPALGPASATAMSFDKATATKASTPPRNTFFNVTPSPTTRGTKPKRATQVFLFVLAAHRPPERIVYSGPRHGTH